MNITNKKKVENCFIEESNMNCEVFSINKKNVEDRVEDDSNDENYNM